jgi:hypothetical protein
MKTLVIVFVNALVACSVAAQRKPAVVTPPPPGNSFRAVLARLYTETSTEDKGNGSITFFSSFPTSGPKGADGAFGERDGFRKITFLTSAASTFGKYNPQALTMYVAVPDCKPPVFFMSPRVFRNSWLFVNQVSVLADADLVLDRPVQAEDKPTREVYPGGVEETVDFALTEKQIAELRKLETAKKVNVRITGSKGYVSLTAKEATLFKDDVAGSIRIYDTVSRMVADKRYDPCS